MYIFTYFLTKFDTCSKFYSNFRLDKIIFDSLIGYETTKIISICFITCSYYINIVFFFCICIYRNEFLVIKRRPIFKIHKRKIVEQKNLDL